jgi:hypothetical protein
MAQRKKAAKKATDRTQVVKITLSRLAPLLAGPNLTTRHSITSKMTVR